MKKYIVTTLPLWAMTAPAIAQDEQEDDSYEDVFVADATAADIVVTGLELSKGDGAYSDTILDLVPDARIENQLRNIPGLQQFRRSDARSANPTSQGVTLRGIGGNAASRAVLLLDGVPQADPFGGWIAWPGYDALPLQQARVTRGGGVGSVGPGALAGTIELFSGNPRRLADINISYGSRDSFEAKGFISAPLGAGSITLSSSHASGDGFIPIIVGQRGAIDRPAAYTQTGAAARFVAPLSPGTEIQANIRAFADERERGFAFSENRNDGGDASIRLVNADGEGWDWSALAYLQFRAFEASFGGGIPADRSSVNQVFEQFNVPSTGLGARFEVRPPVGDNAELRIGGDWRRTVGETNENFFFIAGNPQRSRFAGGETDTYGAFLEGSLQASDTILLTAGGRIDYWQISDGFRREIALPGSVPATNLPDLQFADRDGTEFTSRGGIAWKAAENFTIRGAAYLGWRLPTLNELFRPFRIGADVTGANENLVPERSAGGEIGLEWSNQTFSIGAVAFYTRVRNSVANVTIGSGPGFFPGLGFVPGLARQRQNLEAIETQGLEFDAQLNLDKWIEGLNARAGYSYVDAEVEAQGISAPINGLRPAQIPRHNASGSISWNKDNGTGFGLTARYIGQQFEDDLNSRSLSDAFTLDGRITYAINNLVRIEARAENIFDARVETAISSSGVIERSFPQSFWIGLRLGI